MKAESTGTAGTQGRRRAKACCLVSQMLDEMGLDSRRARELRRQALVGGITFLQWQLARLDEDGLPGGDPGPPRRAPRARRVRVTT
jgi:hypothetical protein